MTAYGVPYLSVCLNCRDEFAPVEYNETAEFCCDDCEDAYWAKEQEFEDLTLDTAAQVYQEDLGRTPPWLKG